VTTTDQLAKTTVYLTPYGGNRMALYGGAAWSQFSLTEISISVPATTVTMYDVFVYDAPGLTLEAVAWTNDTTRATALILQDGVWVKTGELTKRYAGSFRTTGVSGQTEDSLVKRFVWNYYNRVLRAMRAVDTTNSWTYQTDTYRQARASTANQLDLIVGVDEALIGASVYAHSSDDGASARNAIGVGLDSTSSNSAQILVTVQNQASSGNALFKFPAAHYKGHVGVGRHFLAWLERSNSGSTTTWYGDNGLTYLQSGIHGEVMG
jgi:hypothetical protein